MILLIHNKAACKEFLLPNLHNADYEITLQRAVFGLQQKEDAILRLDITGAGWRILKSDGYSLQRSGQEEESRLLCDGDILKLCLSGGDVLNVIVVAKELSFYAMQKYDLSGMQEVSVGCSDGSLIVYQFLGLVSKQHAVCRRERGGWYLYDTSKNGVFSEKGRIAGKVQLQFGQTIHIFGLHLIFLGTILAVGAYYGELHVRADILPPYVQKQPDPEKYSARSKAKKPVYFNRSPRNLPHIYTAPIEIEAPPQPKTLKKKPLLLTIGPAFTMAIPMLLGSGLAIFSASSTGRSTGLYMYTGLVTAVSSAIIGVIWAFANMKYAGKDAEEEEQHRFNAFSNYLMKLADTIRMQYENNTQALRRMYPSADECCHYNAKDPNLWNRNLTHQDFLYVRLGLGQMPFQAPINVPKEKFTLVNDSLIEKPGELYRQYNTLQKVPVGISLLDKQLIGLVGGRNKAGAMQLMLVMAAQIAANHCYTDVKLVFVYREPDKAKQEIWNSLRWLPHVWSEDKRTRYIASDEIEMRDVFFELGNVMRVRSQNQKSSDQRKRIVKPHYVLFISDPALLEGEMLAKYIYEPQPEYGMTAVLMVETAAQLPNTCEDIIENDAYFTGSFNLMNISEERQQIAFDTVTADCIETLARTLSDIRVNETETTGEIPSELDFFEMYGVNTLEDFNVLDRWRKNRTYNSMRALIGKMAGNADCYLDIHEKYHGPHGLVAGTTGSGKSETLQTYILSLALNFSPDDVGFFVIDFKGGGMANLFSDLPHMIGQISNLSGNQVHRAMISIKSENRRRQQIFNEHGVNNINLYTRLYKNHEASIPIPHLFIIIDEFAELKREEPDFMKELISVAQVGRSLGVHLILATQKPGGTVDDNIRSNSKFRLCLRVQDRQDSQEMLGKPDAAYITQAGRGYLQVGNDELYELFQSGYSGAPYDASGGGAAAANMISNTGRTSIVGSRARRMKQQEAPKQKAVKEYTQLDAVVAYLKKLAAENGYDKNLQLWLPVLPQTMYLKQLAGFSAGFGENGWSTAEEKWTLQTPIGLYDDPENQAQHAFVLNFAENGHHAVFGAVASGKSTFLQSLLYALLMKYTPQQLNVYALDFSSRMLSAFEKAPHVGGVIYDNEEDRVSKFFHMLSGMMEERKKLFRGGNFSQYVQAYGQQIPAILVVIDNMAAFREKTGGKYDDKLMRLCREGVGYGIYLIVTASGFGLNEIPSRMGDHIRTLISLEQSDRMKYMDVLHTTHITVVPERDVKGRGIAFIGGRLLEFQTALSVEAEDDFARTQKLQALSEKMQALWTEKRARPIPEIPAEPTLAEFAALDDYAALAAGGDFLPVAYRMEDASVYGVPLATTYCYTIIGKARSGKTNVLKLLLHAAAQVADGSSVVFGNEAGELARSSESCGASYLRTKEEMVAYFSALTDTFKERNRKKRALLDDGLDEAEIYEQMRAEKPIFLFIESLAAFFKLVYRRDVNETNMSGFMENIIEKGSLHRIYFFGCLQNDEMTLLMGYKAFASYVGYKKGMLLGGNVSSQRMFQFQNLAWAEAGKTLKKGYAYVPDEEDETVARRIVVPLVKR